MLQKNHWILIIASFSLLILGSIHIYWVYNLNQYQEQTLLNKAKRITPSIALKLEAASFFSSTDIVNKKSIIPIDAVQSIVDSMLNTVGVFQNYHFAIFQTKENGIYISSTDKYKNNIIVSDYKSCLSCITTIKISDNTKDSTTKDSITFLREVNGEKDPLNKGINEEDYLWFSLYLPATSFFSKRELWGVFGITLILMGILVGLFSYTIRLLNRQKKIGQAKEDFFNNMTHEFKTPLGSILLAAKMLKKNVSNDKKNTYINLIENESKKLEGQVDKILQLSTIDAHEMTFDKQELSINELVIEVIDRLQLIIHNKEAIVSTLLNLQQDIIIGDKTHLSNSVYNLVENALKYAGQHPEIVISTFEKKGRKCISIRDNGIGIPQEHHSEIFERFYRAQKNNQYKGRGFGIGLSYVKAIVNAHRGRIFLNKQLSVGTEFIIEL